MSITDNDYFKDISDQITDEDRIKAGYRIPKKTVSVEDFIKNKSDCPISEDKKQQINNDIKNINNNFHIASDRDRLMMGPPKPIDVKSLRGNLTNIATPIPINFHEGGMFADQEERRSYDRPYNDKPYENSYQPRGRLNFSRITNATLQIIKEEDSKSLNEPNPKTLDEPNPKTLDEPNPETLDEPNSKALEILKTINSDVVSKSNTKMDVFNNDPRMNVFNDDTQLIGKTSSNPFSNTALVVGPGMLTKVNIGDSKVIIGRGPNNSSGRAGFYAGVFSAEKFGSYPTEEQEIRYDALDVDDVDNKGRYIGGIEKLRLEQQQSNQVDYNRKLFEIDYEGKSFKYTGASIGEAIEDGVRQILINEPLPIGKDADIKPQKQIQDQPHDQQQGQQQGQQQDQPHDQQQDHQQGQKEYIHIQNNKIDELCELVNEQNNKINKICQLVIDQNALIDQLVNNQNILFKELMDQIKNKNEIQSQKKPFFASIWNYFN